MGAICSCCLTSFSLHPANVDGRLNVDLNVLLTVVAFLLVVSGMVPPVSYVTLMQQYVLGNFGFVMLQTFAHTVLPRLVCKTVDLSPLTLPPLQSECEEDLLYLDQ